MRSALAIIVGVFALRATAVPHVQHHESSIGGDGVASRQAAQNAATGQTPNTADLLDAEVFLEDDPNKSVPKWYKGTAIVTSTWCPTLVKGACTSHQSQIRARWGVHEAPQPWEVVNGPWYPIDANEGCHKKPSQAPGLVDICFRWADRRAKLLYQVAGGDWKKLCLCQHSERFCEKGWNWKITSETFLECPCQGSVWWGGSDW